MRYLISIHHPAQVHFFRHVIDHLEERGDDVLVCAREKDVAIELLENYDLPYRVLAGTAESIPGLVAQQLRYESKLFRVARSFDPDVITSIGGVEISHVAPFVDARTIAFNDSEGTPSHRIMAIQFLDAVHTPRRFSGDFGRCHARYDGYHELAYLHPDRFSPDQDRLWEHGVDVEDRYFVLRFVGWNAHHDVGQRGLSLEAKRELVDRLSSEGDVYITNEGALPKEFEQYRIPVPPHVIHDLLYHADLYVGDSQTMATEAALLGTPAVRSNTFADGESMTNFVELAEYGLLHSTPDEDDAVATAIALARDPDSTERWQRRREQLLAEKIDVTEYVLEVLREEARKARKGRPAERQSGIGRWQTFLPGGGTE